MPQVLTFPEPISSLAVRRPGREKFSDEDYWAFGLANPDLGSNAPRKEKLSLCPQPVESLMIVPLK
jgi:hypothetical protein